MGAQTSQISTSPFIDAKKVETPPPAEPEKGKACESTPAEKKKCKACCACPETKRARDDCFVQYGEENCTELMEAHRKCMKEHGFNI